MSQKCKQDFSKEAEDPGVRTSRSTQSKTVENMFEHRGVVRDVSGSGTLLRMSARVPDDRLFEVR